MANFASNSANLVIKRPLKRHNAERITIFTNNSFSVISELFSALSHGEGVIEVMAKKVKSIEEQVEDWCKAQFSTTKYYTKNESINQEIDSALKKAPSKAGGTGENYPDIKVLLEFDDLSRVPVMIEVKGSYGDFIKTGDDGKVAYKNGKGEIQHSYITKYAVNGAVHYARAIIDNTESYDEAIAIGVNGYDTSTGRKFEIGAFYINKNNLYVPIQIGEYTDLSFLQKKYLRQLRQRLNELSLTEEEINKAKNDLENEIDVNLKYINQKMEDELKISVGYRVKLIAGLVMAGLGVPGKVKPLHVADLSGESGENSHDGAKIVNKIKDYLQEKHLPAEKINMIMNELYQVFLHSKLHLPEENGESRLHTLYNDVRTSLLPFLNGELHNIDFTGRLFNVLNDWVDVPDGDRNDVVLTPRYVTELMARLCGVNMDSYVWDFATGSAGFLISAMNQMIKDAEAKLKEKSPAEFDEKLLHIKMQQLLGIEKLPDIYLLAVLNMILMKDGSTNLIHGDSLKDFNGTYEQGELKGTAFPANVFLLNPPYSAPGKGFNFVAKALGMMNHGGMAAVLIQENAGSGNGLPYTAEILQHNTLRASIHMADIFLGKSSVQTAIYVFDVGRPHNPKDVVRFIDFTNDGYSRQNRKKSSQNVNLRDTDNAEARYNEVYNLVTFGRGVGDKNLNYFRDAYVEDTISLDGKDWTYKQHQRIDPTPTYDDFYKVVSEYLAWRVGEVLKNQNSDGLGK